MKETLSSLFDSDKSKGKNTIPELLFKSRNDAHITHLLNRDKTLATHIALEKYYEEILDLADTFIESSLPLYPVKDICVAESCCIDNPLDYFQSLYKEIDKLRSKYKESFLQNQIDEVQALVNHTIYRLKYITQ